MKCPSCRKGDLFEKPFLFTKPLAMHKKCSHCDQNFEPEPGYYFGAMFISYIWTGFFCLCLVGFTMLVLGWSAGSAIGTLIGLYVISYFWIMRISRSMYIHFDIPYNEKYK